MMENQKVASSKKELIWIALIVLYRCIGCPIRFFVGITCPGCGMTRAVSSLAQLDLLQALKYHPLIVLLPFYVILGFAQKRIHERWLTIIAGISVLLFGLVYAIRLYCHDPVVQWSFENGFFNQLIYYK